MMRGPLDFNKKKAVWDTFGPRLAIDSFLQIIGLPKQNFNLIMT